MTDVKAETKDTKNPIHIKKYITEIIEQIEESSTHDEGSEYHIEALNGVDTGFRDFNKKLISLNNSELIIVAGRPAMGKTSFLLNIAENAAVQQQLTVAIFSLEMTAKQVTNRLISSMSRLNSNKIKRGDLVDSEWPRLMQSQQLLHNSKIFVDDEPTRTPEGIRKACLKLKKDKGLDLVVIDYLQLIQVYGHKDRVDEITKISRSLKVLARELEIPVIVASQLNRSLEQRMDKRPVLSDTRDSGAIEEDADLILFIYRDEVYNEESMHKGKAEIIIAKNRTGSAGKVTLSFFSEVTRFEDYINQ